jgi:hypothetical protein
VTTLSLRFHDSAGAIERNVEIHKAIIAGWTGRDRAALEKHIKELEELGVARPASTPIFYRVAASRFTSAPRMEVSGSDSSGEAEFALLKTDGMLWVGVGSDHTDRKVETYNVTVSKQMCDKPVGRDFWRFDDVAAHWDRLMLRSFAYERGERRLYQEGMVTAMLPPLDLIARYRETAEFADGTLMFCGTLAAKGGIRPAERLELQLEDPILSRTITHFYDIVSLPVLG